MTENTNNVTVVQLDPKSLDDLAHRIADLVGCKLQPQASRPGAAEEGRLLTAAQVAERWGVDRSWVYDHAQQLGARRLGAGKRPRLRFDPADVAAYLQPLDRHAGAREDDLGTGGDGRDVRRSPRTQPDCAKGLHIGVGSELWSSRSPRRRPGAPKARPARRSGRRVPQETPAPAPPADQPVRSRTPSSAPAPPRR